MVEHGRLECRNKETRCRRINRSQRLGWRMLIAQRPKQIPLDLEHLGHQLKPIPIPPVGIRLACIDAAFGCAGFGRENQVDCALRIAQDHRAADEVVVHQEPEALLADAIGCAVLGQQVERLLGAADSQWIDIADFDRESVAFEVPALEFVGVQVNPED